MALRTITVFLFVALSLMINHSVARANGCDLEARAWWDSFAENSKMARAGVVDAEENLRNTPPAYKAAVKDFCGALGAFRAFWEEKLVKLKYVTRVCAGMPLTTGVVLGPDIYDHYVKDIQNIQAMENHYCYMLQ